MLHFSYRSQQAPDKAAIIMGGDGFTVTFKELDERSNKAAHLFRQLGLQRGDHIAFLMENHPQFFEICWAAQKAGLYYTPISYYLKPDEIAYIVDNADAQLLISSKKQLGSVSGIEALCPKLRHCFVTGD